MYVNYKDIRQIFLFSFNKLVIQWLNIVHFVSVCTDGDVRLTGGLTENEGTVEICFDSLLGLVA